MELEEQLARWLPLGWTEAYEDFASYLKHVGVKLEPRPRFGPGQAVTVACSPGVIALREGDNEDIERTLELERLDAFELRQEDMDKWQFYVLAARGRHSAVFRLKDTTKEVKK